jgi:hypothetical protein
MPVRTYHRSFTTLGQAQKSYAEFVANYGSVIVFRDGGLCPVSVKLQLKDHGEDLVWDDAPKSVAVTEIQGHITTQDATDLFRLPSGKLDELACRCLGKSRRPNPRYSVDLEVTLS